MNVVVCVKFTPDAGDIEVRGDGSISLDRAEWGIGGFDLQAIEAGARLVEQHGGKLTALSAGPQKINNSKLKKDVLSRGPDELVMVIDESLADADTALTARVLAAAIQQLQPVDLVLCGEGSADLYFQQVGLQIGERLGVTTLNAVSGITVENGALVVERTLEDDVEVLEAPLPAVLQVTTDIHQPRLPKMTDILKAGKKPVREVTIAEVGLANLLKKGMETLSTRAPRQVQRKKTVLSGAPEEAAQALVAHLRREGIL